MRLNVLSMSLVVALVCAAAPSAKAQWTDLGNGLAGTSGVPPVLLTTGGIFPSANTAITLTGGMPATTAFLVVGLSNVGVPLKGGVLVPFPNYFLAMNLDHTGSWALNFPWPNGLPAGFQLFWQVWMPDAGGPHGFAASNACASSAL